MTSVAHIRQKCTTSAKKLPPIKLLKVAKTVKRFNVIMAINAVELDD